MRYYIADCHFFHEALNREMDHRGFASVEEMNEYMIKRWNEKVRNRDEVVILGDLSMGNAEQTNALLDRLQGKLFLIVGNHDNRYLRSKTFHKERFGDFKLLASPDCISMAVFQLSCSIEPTTKPFLLSLLKTAVTS